MDAKVVDIVMLLSVRPAAPDAVLTERATQVRPAQQWANQMTAADKSSTRLLHAADFSQMIRFEQAVPLGWTTSFERILDPEEDAASAAAVAAAMPMSSALLTHQPRMTAPSLEDLVSGPLRRVGNDKNGHVLAIDLLGRWALRGGNRREEEPSSTNAGTNAGKRSQTGEESTGQDDDMEAAIRNMHELRLISVERHQLEPPWSHLPWHIGVTDMLSAYLGGVIVE
jgi:hypothetical protein